MGFFDKLKFEVWDSIGVVVSQLRECDPAACKTEKDFEKSLYSWLHAQLPDIQVTKQFAQGRIRADLSVSGRVIMELKNNLDTTAKYQRLVGQIMEYKNWNGRVVVLLTGTTEPNLRKELDTLLRHEGLSDDLDDAKAVVFDK